MEVLFFQTGAVNPLLGSVPDALGLLIFGIGLIVLAAALRWFFKRQEAVESGKFSASVHTTG